MNDFGRLLIAAGMIASPWLISACGNTTGGDDDKESGSGRSGICNAICERAQECGVRSMNECVQTCRDDDVSSSAALQVVEICADEVSCNGFQNGDLAECVGDGIADLDRSTAAEDYCDTLGDWAAECVGEAISSAECYSTANAVSSVYLTEISECLDEGCEDAADCVESVETRYDVGDSIIQLVANGFGGSTTNCCSAGDPCDWADDNECDCGGDFAWDASDCDSDPGPNSCISANNGECDEPNTCAAGTDTADCEGAQVDCCATGDPCGWANDGICDCGGDYAWDATDCAAAVDDSCQYALDNICDEPEYCATGTDATDCELEPVCCVAGDPCGWAIDTFCNCEGAFTWDANDCHDSCVYANDGECDEPQYCATGTDTTDCTPGACCVAGDPCDWANDDICDCGGELAWDANDCGGTVGCCQAGDPCDWADDDICDCGGEFAWDANDCGGSAGNECCQANDPCDWANDDICDCDGEFAWDAVDCAAGL